MTVEILENIHQEVSRIENLVRGGYDIDCGEDLTQFSMDDTLILALEYWNLSSDSSLFLTNCGLHYLRYENGFVLGQISETLTSQPIEEFRETLFTCVEVPVSSEDHLRAKDLKIFPNPVSDILQIEIENDFIENIEVFNSNGQLMIQNTNE